MLPMDTDSHGLVRTEHDAQEDANHPARSAVASYIKSMDFFELLCCAVFALLCSLVEMVDSSSLRMRDIPYQLLENSGDVVYNLSLRETLQDDTVSNLMLVFVTVVIPLFLQFALSKFAFLAPSRTLLGESHSTVCVYLVGVGLTTLVTGLVKNYVGYLRPIFYDLCEPDENNNECTGDDERDGRRSFPSGHASTAFCGMILFTLYLLDHFGVNSCDAVMLREDRNGEIVARYRRPPRIKRLVSILSLSPMGVAIFIAASRVADNKHFPADVVGGSFIGASIGWFTHRLWFPAWPLQ